MFATVCGRDGTYSEHVGVARYLVDQRLLVANYDDTIPTVDQFSPGFVVTGGLSGVVTNVVPVFMTNLVQAPVTTLVAKLGAGAASEAPGSVVNTFARGIGSIATLTLCGPYHGYHRLRNRKVNEAVIQGVETARAVLATTRQVQAAGAQFLKWLMESRGIEIEPCPDLV